MLRPMLIGGTLELPSEEQVQQLSDALLESDDEQEQLVLARVLTWINSRPRLPATEETSGDQPPMTASGWFWGSLMSPSIVFRAWEKHRRRDEDAMFNLARFLSFESYPDVQFQRVPLESFDWGEALKSHLSTVVFIGRLGMYGESATEHFSRENWYRFLSDERPEDLGLDELDPRYHRICALDEQETDEPQYLTHEDEEKAIRTDYGLVQRYTVPYQGGRITVIGLWGCSTLGTLGAVRWAIDLEKNTDPLPNADLKADTTLEALIKVRADTCNYPYTWNPEPVQLEELHIGHEQWNVDKKCWEVLPSTTLGWQSTGKDAGRIIIGGEVQRTSGMIAKIIDALATRDLKPGEVIDLGKILSEVDLARWKRDRSTLGSRIQKKSFNGIVAEGKQSLRVLIPIEIIPSEE